MTSFGAWISTETFDVVCSVIGFLAGSLCTASAFPQIIRICRHADEAAQQSLLRNLGLTCGNGLWVLYGTMKGVWPVIAMCMLACALNGIVTWQVMRARTRLREQSS